MYANDIAIILEKKEQKLNLVRAHCTSEEERIMEIEKEI